MAYAAFISYSHSGEGKIASRLQTSLQRLARPWYGFGGLKICRDDTSLAITPSLRRDIHRAMDDSEYFILLACPEAAQSSWVAEEAGYWLTHKSAKTLLIVVTGGSVVWDSAAGDFDWTRTNALPQNLRRVFPEEPFYSDLSVFARSERVSLKDPEFRLAVAKLTARLCKCAVEDIEGEDKRQRGKFRRYVAAAVLLLALAGAVTLYYDLMAINRKIISIAQQLATQAAQERRDAGDHERAALLARQAWLFLNERGGRQLGDIDAALRQVIEPAYFAVQLGPAAGELNLITVSPDGRWIAGTDPSGGTWLFDLQRQGSRPRKLPPAPARLRTLGFSRESERLNGLTADDRVVQWNLSAPAVEPAVTPLPPAEGLVGAVTLSPSGRWLASARPDGAVLVWNLSHLAAPPRMLCCHPEGVTALAFEPKQEETLVAGSGDGRLRLWDLSRPAAPLGVSPLLPASIAAIGYRNDGALIAAATMPVSTEFTDLLHDFIREANTAPAPKPPAVFLWNPRHPETAPRRIAEQDGNISAVVFTDQEQVAALSTKGRSISLWRANGGPAQAAELRSEHTLAGLAVTPGSTFLASFEALTSPKGPQSLLRLWRLQPSPAAPVVRRPSDGPVAALAFHPSGQIVASAAHQSAAVWNPRTGAISPLDHGDANAVAIAFSPDGNWLASGSESLMASEHDFSLRLWHSPDWKTPCRRYDDHASRVAAIAFSPDGQWIASAGRSDGMIRVRRVDAAPEDSPRQVHAAGEVYSMAFRSAGQLIWGSGDGGVWFADPSQPSHAESRTAAHEGPVRSLAIGRHGQLLLSGGDDGRVLLWSFRRNQPVREELGRLPGAVNAVATDAEGNFAAAAGRDGVVRLWDLRRTATSPALLGSGGNLLSVAFSPDGTRIAAGRNDGEIALWSGTKMLADSVCQLVWRNLSREEWSQFIGKELPYQRTCPNLGDGQ